MGEIKWEPQWESFKKESIPGEAGVLTHTFIFSTHQHPMLKPHLCVNL